MKLAPTLTALALGATLATSALAQDRMLRLGTGVPSAHPAHAAFEDFAAKLSTESEGRLGGTIFGPEIASVGGMKAALQSSVVEAGTIVPLYYASELPNSALIAELTMIGNTPAVMMAASTEYIVTCADCLREFTEAGFVYMGGAATSPYMLLLKDKEVRTQADLEGLKLRSGGAPHARWADAMGATPVSVGLTETFESMSQGVVDGTMAAMTDLLAFRLVDIATSVTPIQLGTYYSIATFAPAAAVWGGLSLDDRAAFVRAANSANASFTYNWSERLPAGAEGAAADAGITMNTPDQSLLDATAAFVERDVAGLPASAQDKYGISDAEAKIARFRDLVTKWSGLLEGVDDPAEVAALMQAEIWDKVDLSAYGL